MEPLIMEEVVDIEQEASPTLPSRYLSRIKSVNNLVSQQSSCTLTRQLQDSSFKRILVTGGAGFLGLHLCRRLLDMGHEVLCLDNLFTSQRQNLLPLIEKYRKFEFIRGDVTNHFYVEVDEIYNLACPASPVHYQYNPIKTTKVSVLGAFNVLGLAKRIKARVFQASTSEVYGDPNISPQPEDYYGHVNCIGVRACYDEGKRVAETLFFDYYRQHNVDIRVARIFNTYGVGMHPYDGRVVSNFIIQALTGQDITIYGDGKHTRSFCYVDDLIDGIIRFMENPDFIGPMNLGNPHEISVHELALMILEKTKSTSKIIFKPLPSNDPKQRKPDITLAKKIIKFKPIVSIEEGLDKTIEYFRSIDLNNYRAPTSHNAHTNTEKYEQEQSKKQKLIHD